MDASALAEKGPAISSETAEKEVNRFFDFYDVVVKEDAPVLKAAQERIHRAIMTGKVSFSDTEDGISVHQILVRPCKHFSSLDYGTVSGKTKLSMKNCGEDPYSQMYTMLASLSGRNVAEFMDVKAPDIGLCEALAMVFLRG